MPKQVLTIVPPGSRAAAGGILLGEQLDALNAWVGVQAVNVLRHAQALRPFDKAEFGTDDAAPSEGHIEAVNEMISKLRTALEEHTKEVTDLAAASAEKPTTATLQQLVKHKNHSHDWVLAIERIWDFYFELFGQRQSFPYANWLLSCDRIALDCYQAAYLGVGRFKPIPAPPPFSYMRTGFSPATFRRGIPLRRLGHLLNPFPLIQLPYHRLVNPWTLGATLHELSHNLQTDLGLSRVVPKNIARVLLRSGSSPFVASAWTQWNRELFADVSGLLLGGPAFVPSLMDVVGRSVRATLNFTPGAVHPTPYLRPYICLELLRRMGFAREAEEYRRVWQTAYPNPRAGNIPAEILGTFKKANRLVVDAVCFQPYEELGNRSLAQVLRFGAKEQQIIEQAAERLARGTDPGVIPPRFMVGAARYAVDHKLASPEAIMTNFYKELDWR